MSNHTATLKRLTGIGSAAPATASKGELVPVPSAVQLLAGAQADHEAAEAAAQSAVVSAIAAGKKLLAAKKALPHGTFEDAVASSCRFTIETAQKYMRLARREVQFLELVRQRQSLGLHLSMKDALKLLNKLNAEGKPKPIKRKPAPS
jgi:hypothetical protein